MQTQEPELPEFLAKHQYDKVEPEKSDSMLAVRVILLVAAGISAFTAPWLITFFFVVAWLVTMFWPRND